MNNFMWTVGVSGIVFFLSALIVRDLLKRFKSYSPRMTRVRWTFVLSFCAISCSAFYFLHHQPIHPMRGMTMHLNPQSEYRVSMDKGLAFTVCFAFGFNTRAMMMGARKF